MLLFLNNNYCWTTSSATPAFRLDAVLIFLKNVHVAKGIALPPDPVFWRSVCFSGLGGPLFIVNNTLFCIWVSKTQCFFNVFVSNHQKHNRNQHFLLLNSLWGLPGAFWGVLGASWAPILLQDGSRCFFWGFGKQFSSLWLCRNSFWKPIS